MSKFRKYLTLEEIKGRLRFDGPKFCRIIITVVYYMVQVVITTIYKTIVVAPIDKERRIGYIYSCSLN